MQRTVKVRKRPKTGLSGRNIAYGGVVYMPGALVGNTVVVMPLKVFRSIKKAVKSNRTRLNKILRVAKCEG